MDKDKEVQRLTDSLKYIKNIAMSSAHLPIDGGKMYDGLWRINNVASNALNLKYDELAE